MKNQSSFKRSFAGATIILFFLMVFAAGCSTPETIPAEQVMQTRVAETLTAQPTSTPPPTITPIPSATIATSPTSTVAPTPTEGPSPTPTVPVLPADDPRFGLDLNAPVYLDTFSERFSWGELYDESTSILWEEGVLVAQDNLADGYIWWSTTTASGGNIFLEVSAQTEDCSGKDSYGAAIRIGGEDANRAYALEFSCDGHYRIRRFMNGGVSDLLGWTFSSSILSGSNQINRMGIAAQGYDLIAVANGDLLESVEDSSVLDGIFGLYANAIETPGMKVIFDDFSLWYITP
jgi:hypothetical protein